MRGDDYGQATRFFLSRAKGSFGLCVSCSLDSHVRPDSVMPFCCSLVYRQLCHALLSSTSLSAQLCLALCLAMSRSLF